jgi:hypothetical protein
MRRVENEPLAYIFTWRAALLALALALSVSCSSDTQERINTVYTPSPSSQTHLPEAAWKYRLLLLKWTISFFGDESYISVFAGQIHQESYWCRYTVSSAGAKGCSQFMDRTAQWAIDDPNGLPCAVLDDFLDPVCAIPALVWLNRFNYVRSPQKAACDTLAFMLSKYNGGGVYADQRAAEAAGSDPELWFNHVEKYNGRHRTAANFKENRGYPRKILLELQKIYFLARYGGVEVCNFALI